MLVLHDVRDAISTRCFAISSGAAGEVLYSCLIVPLVFTISLVLSLALKLIGRARSFVVPKKRNV